MNQDDVQAWLDRYVACWHSYDEAEIGQLFSEQAEYRYQPWGEPVVGREAIVKDWLAPGGNSAQADVAGTFEAAYVPFAIDGDVAIAVGTTKYWKDATHAEVARAYHNVYLLTFDGDGRCSSFTEYFMETPKRLW